MPCSIRALLPCLVLLTAISSSLPGQTPANSNADAPLTDRERMLLDHVAELEKRVEALENKLAVVNSAPAGASPAANAPAAAPSPSASASEQAAVPAKVAEPVLPPTFLDGTTLNLTLDTYYGYNFNDPIGRVNLLRAYDVSSNAVSLNQAGLILDNEPDADKGKRWGFRLDFQYGQATETLQGNNVNEPRPEIYRNIFQAYGSYVIPIGKGLRVDVGKFSSSLGIEGNYTKDQMNYSRGFWFNYLPYYHMGLRATYPVSNVLTLNYWLVNGTQQTEPFNGYKDEFFGLALTPRKNLTWNVNYYLGQEHPDVMYFPNGGAPANAPTLQGVPFEPIVNAPQGKLHIFDTYANWQASSKWTFAGEADYVVQRLHESSSPTHTDGGALYVQYQLTPKLSLAGRAEYLSDRGGMFSGLTQALKETTATMKYQFADGFDAFGEWRRDFSNRPYFYTSTLGLLKNEQNTATLGLVWWWGGKQGSW